MTTHGISAQLMMGAVMEEIAVADAKYGPPLSAAESYGVLSEEVAELLWAIRSRQLGDIKAEAVQVAAVALRLAEWCDRNANNPTPRI